jgi:N-acetylmuramic acid 6-phosphate (MurNAc-6-P) etherase
VDASTAERALRQLNYDLPLALVTLKSGATAREARRVLGFTSGNVREALALLGKPHLKKKPKHD